MAELSEKISLAFLSCEGLVKELHGKKLTGEEYRIKPDTVGLVRYRPLVGDGVDLIVQAMDNTKDANGIMSVNFKILYQRGITSPEDFTQPNNDRLKDEARRTKHSLTLFSTENPRHLTEPQLEYVRERTQLFQFSDRVSFLLMHGETPAQVIQILRDHPDEIGKETIGGCMKWRKWASSDITKLTKIILDILQHKPVSSLRGGNKSTIKRSYKRKNKRKNKTRKYRK